MVRLTERFRPDGEGKMIFDPVWFLHTRWAVRKGGGRSREKKTGSRNQKRQPQSAKLGWIPEPHMKKETGYIFIEEREGDGPLGNRRYGGSSPLWRETSYQKHDWPGKENRCVAGMIGSRGDGLLETPSQRKERKQCPWGRGGTIRLTA